MIKTIYICDKCGKQKTVHNWTSYKDKPKDWLIDYTKNKQYCSKKCKPKPKKIKYKDNDFYDSGPGVGSLYGRT